MHVSWTGRDLGTREWNRFIVQLEKEVAGENGFLECPEAPHPATAENPKALLQWGYAVGMEILELTIEYQHGGIAVDLAK